MGEHRFTWGHARYHRGRLRRRHAHTRVIPHRKFGSRKKWGRIIILVGKNSFVLIRSAENLSFRYSVQILVVISWCCWCGCSFILSLSLFVSQLSCLPSS